MKKILLLFYFMIIHMVSNACEVCKKQQPKVLRGITHGAGPESDWDYVVIWSVVLIVIISLFYAIKWIIRPGEKESKHIKYSILNSD
jgi:phage shock protein PspC (stress-responsive transcriptional regulator)